MFFFFYVIVFFPRKFTFQFTLKIMLEYDESSSFLVRVRKSHGVTFSGGNLIMKFFMDLWW